MVEPNRHQETGALREVWKELNKLRDYCISIRPAKGLNTRLKRTSRGTIINTDPAEEAETVIVAKQFRVVSVQNDYIVGHEFDGTTEASEETLIAKPYRLRRTPFHGTSTTVTLEDPISGNQSVSLSYTYHSPTFRVVNVTSLLVNGPEKQLIIPLYVAGNSIYAIEPENGTGVTGVTWLDINADGRAWAKK